MVPLEQEVSHFAGAIPDTVEAQAEFVIPKDPDGDGTNEAVEFTDVGTVSTTYTVVADLSDQRIGDTGTVEVKSGSGVTVASDTYTIEMDTGPLSPDNPFGDSNNDPIDRGEVINRIVEWNLDENNEIDGTEYTRGEVINYIVEWNLA